jgi:hypothetical protein
VRANGKWGRGRELRTEEARVLPLPLESLLTAARGSFMYIGSPNGPIQRLEPVRYVQYECYETTARSETRKLARVRPARCPA